MTRPPGSVAVPTAAELAAIAAILHDSAGIVISPGKASMVQSRLARRLRLLGLPDFASYIALVRSSAGLEERRNMISALTTNVTHFFREQHHFDMLRQSVLPPLLARARAGERVRIWSAGCSSGQEAYSIAMVIAGMAGDLSQLDLRILATDIDPNMIAQGHLAIYDPGLLADLPIPLRRRFFEPVPQGERVVGSLRRLVSFRELNLHDRWPMRGQFDVIFCRNVVIYFDAPSQDRLWPRFEQALAPGGWLFVGHSERVPPHPDSMLKNAGITTYRLDSTSPNGGCRWH